MRVTLRLHAVLRAREGVSELQVDLASGASVADLLDGYFSTRPEQALVRPHLRVALRDRLVGLDEDLGLIELRDGDFLDALPPASGGSDELAWLVVDGTSGGRPTRRLVSLAAAPLDPRLPDRLTALVAAPTDGAIVAFAGRTRVTPGTPAPGEESAAARVAGERVAALEYEAAEALALAELASICDSILAAARGEVGGIAIVHATGNVPVRSASMHSVVTGPHRERTYAASMELIDAVKRSVPIWKAEHFESGVVWAANPGALRAPGL